jgi:hypothetical protein
MDKNRMSTRSYAILGGVAGIAGVALLLVSFAINAGPPANATRAELGEARPGAGHRSIHFPLLLNRR